MGTGRYIDKGESILITGAAEVGKSYREATIIASQLPVSKWYDVIGNEVIADAVLDRVVHSSHRFDLKGESLRKKL